MPAPPPPRLGPQVPAGAAACLRPPDTLGRQGPSPGLLSPGMLGVVVSRELRLGWESRPIFLSFSALCLLLRSHCFSVSTFVNLLLCARSEAEKKARCRSPCPHEVYTLVRKSEPKTNVHKCFLVASHDFSEVGVALFDVVLGTEPNFYH